MEEVLLKQILKVLKKSVPAKSSFFFKLLDGQAVLLNLTKTLLVLKDFISLREYLRVLDSV